MAKQEVISNLGFHSWAEGSLRWKVQCAVDLETWKQIRTIMKDKEIHEAGLIRKWILEGIKNDRRTIPKD